MDRRLLFPAIAATAWAQQASPAAAEAEKALRERVDKYYTLMVAKKFREAEALVAEESKDDYYNGKKPDIKGFDIEKVELQDHGTRAKVTIKAKVLVLMLGAGAKVFEMPTPTYWKLENGQWCWYIPAEVKAMTPFGKLQTGAAAGRTLDTRGQAPGGIASPNVAALQNQVSIDRTSVSLTAEKPEETVTITNSLKGPVDLRLDPHAASIKGLKVDIDRTHLNSGEKATIRIHSDGQSKISDVVEIVAFPLNRVFDIEVIAK